MPWSLVLVQAFRYSPQGRPPRDCNRFRWIRHRPNGCRSHFLIFPLQPPTHAILRLPSSPPSQDKIAVSVFVAAYMPSSGTFVSLAQGLEKYRQRLGSLEDTEINYGRGPDNPPTSVKLGIRFCRKYLYQNSPSQDITLAGTLLRSSPFLEERISYTKERYGKIARVYVVTEEDRAIPEESQRAMIAENPPDGVYEIEGSDHGAFFSNPYLLAHILVEIANIYGP